MSIAAGLREPPTAARIYAFSSFRRTGPRIRLAAGVLGSLALFPLAAVQGTVTRSRMPSLRPAEPPHRGWVAGKGRSLRVLAIGDSAISGVGVARGDETVSATTARALARLTGRPVAWRAIGLSDATVSRAMKQLVPRLASEPADLVVVAFGANDVVAYRSPSAFADTLAALVTAARARVGDAAVVIAGVAPLALFPGLPWPLRTILGWRCAALQASAERLTEWLPRVVVERFGAAFSRTCLPVMVFIPMRERMLYCRVGGAAIG